MIHAIVVAWSSIAPCRCIYAKTWISVIKIRICCDCTIAFFVHSFIPLPWIFPVILCNSRAVSRWHPCLEPDRVQIGHRNLSMSNSEKKEIRTWCASTNAFFTFHFHFLPGVEPFLRRESSIVLWWIHWSAFDFLETNTNCIDRDLRQ